MAAFPYSISFSLFLVFCLLRSYNAQDNLNVLVDSVKQLAQLPPQLQESFLYGIGATFQASQGMDCNIFGGPNACKLLPSTSSLLSQCPGAESKVDCAFYAQTVNEVYDSPVDELQTFLSNQKWAPAKEDCPQCFDQLSKLWCALATPRCGTFQMLTRTALLPALTSITKAEETGGDVVEAVADAIGDTVEAISSALPCREMCLELVTTCGCSPGRNDTFGKLFSYAKKAGAKVSDALQEALLAKVWDRPFCDMFSPRNAPGFAGRCDVSAPGSAAAAAATGAATCTSRDKWCAPTSGGIDGASMPAGDGVLFYVQGLIAIQFARAATGWLMDDNLGAMATKRALSRGEHRHTLDELSKKYVDGRVQYDTDQRPPSSGLSGGQVAAVVVLSVLGGAVLAMAGLATYKYVTTKRSEQFYMELQAGSAFTKLAASDGAL